MLRLEVGEKKIEGRLIQTKNGLTTDKFDVTKVVDTEWRDKLVLVAILGAFIVLLFVGAFILFKMRSKKRLAKEEGNPINELFLDKKRENLAHEIKLQVVPYKSEKMEKKRTMSEQNLTYV